MKNLILKLILPLAIISFVIFTKWWYVLPADAPNTMYSGFPFPYIGEGWHTSMSLQIFVLELIVDWIIYFLFLSVLVFSINMLVEKIKLYKSVTILLWLVAGTIIAAALYFGSFSEHIFYFKRPYEMKVMETGYKFIWERTERPDDGKYYPEK